VSAVTPTAAEREAWLVELSEMPGFLATRLGSLGSDEAARVGTRGGFSPVEHCWHLADLEREGYAVRIERLLREHEPLLPDFDGARLAEERAYRGRQLAEGIRAFRAARQSNIDVLRSLGSAEWSRSGSQQGVGAICLSDVLRMMVEHDRSHRTEIEAA